ncbi:MAG: SMEK domain-containing protein [Methylococcaceae bacterium]|nr:SMEK domain-containing protein [Methylococcaceae bacterium]
MNRQDYIEQITQALALLSRTVEINSSLNLTDINIHAENFYRDLLNLALGYKLENINTINPNAASIDLGDIENNIAIQVTSTSAISKTRKTVEKFIEKKLYNDYERLVILNLVGVTRHKDPFIGDAEKYQIDTKKDIWDYIDFARKINDKDTDSLKVIANFLHNELKITPDSRLPKEVQTIIALIDHLSNFESPAPKINKIFLEAPDPNRKINQRFSDYSDFLTERYIELLHVYGPSLDTVKKETDIGTVQVVKKSLYLKTFSDNVLTKCNGDPKVALDKLTQEFANILERKGIEYDETAITFFLVDELIRCNVFPNVEKIND